MDLAVGCVEFVQLAVRRLAADRDVQVTCLVKGESACRDIVWNNRVEVGVHAPDNLLAVPNAVMDFSSHDPNHGLRHGDPQSS